MAADAVSLKKYKLRFCTYKQIPLHLLTKGFAALLIQLC